MLLSLVYLLLSVQNIQSETAQEVLNTFQLELQVNTVITFAYNITPEDWPEPTLNFNLQPKLVITAESGSELRKVLGEGVLSFLFIDHFGETYLDDIVKPSLLNLHLKDLLFYTNSSLTSADSESWLWLFEWCRANGFWHVLLMNADQQYLTMDTIPDMTIKSITLPGYLEKRHRRDANLQGYPIKVAVGNNPPRVNAYFNSSGHLQLSGFYGHAVKMFAAAYKASLDFVIMPNMSRYSVLSCIQSIKDHKVDVCSDAILFGTGIETTRPYDISNARLMVPFDKPLELYNYFRKPYGNDVWPLIFAAFMGLVLLLTLLEYKEYRQVRLVRNIFTTFQSFICVSFNLHHIPQTYRWGLESLLIFSGFILSNCYLAYLSSILLTKIYHRDIDSIHDVIEHNLTILTTKFHQYILEKSSADEEVRRQTIVVSEEVVYQNLKNLNPAYVYYALDNKMDFYLYQQKFMSRPRMKKLGNEVVTTDIGEIPMRSYWPLQDMFMDFMDNLYCSGIFGQLQVETSQEGIRLGQIKFFPTEVLSVEPLSLEYFVMCGIILMTGYCLSSLCFLVEMIVYYERERK